MNSCCLVGTLTRAPVVRFEAEGTQTATFTLAITEPSRAGKPYTALQEQTTDFLR